MNPGFQKRLLIAWLALSAITMLSFWARSLDGQDAIRPNAGLTFTVIVIAMIKVRVILREFMEVRHAPVLLGRLTDGWLLLTAATLLGTYFVGMAVSTG